MIVLALLTLAGCSADDIHSPQKFFPGSTLTSWDACSKSTTVGNAITLCASTGLMPGASAPSYNIQFSLPGPAHVRIAVFDEHAAFVKLVFDSDEPATLPGEFRQPPVSWNFDNASGQRVPPGDYRLYFQSGQFISTSDVRVE